MEPKKKKIVYEMQINPLDPESGVFAMSLVENPAIESNFTFLSKIKEPIMLKTLSEEKRLVVGPSLIPNKEIARQAPDGSEYFITFSEKVVEQASQLYLKRGHQWNTTLEHDGEVSGVSLVESWIVEDPKRDKAAALGLTDGIVKGTWMIAMSIDNNEIWQQYVKTGIVQGFSLEGMFSEKLVEASAVDIDVEAPNLDPNESKLQDLRVVLESYLSTLK
jgi:hypothetical protein